MAIAAPDLARDRAPSPSPAEARRTFAVALGAHVLHDGYTDLIYVMLPIWQTEFALTYAAVGLVRAVMAGTMASFQIPAGLLAERLGPVLVLAVGTALSGLCFCLAGLSAGLASLIAVLFVGGLGASTQHPIASALVARAYAGAGSRAALGTYNFAGDVGKMTLPASGALLMTLMPWRPTLALLGLVGLAAGAAIFLLTPRGGDDRHDRTAMQAAPDSRTPSRRQRAGFPLLLTIGILDSATRMGFLTFLPFLLTAKGASLPTIGLALTLVFVGGAAGKLVCAFLGARIGVLATVCLTEGATALGIVALLPLPLDLGLVLLPVIGVALNGTSSVLYGSVPELVSPQARTRAFGIFYTGTIGSGAIAPILYGFIGDAFGVSTTLVVIAAGVLLTMPLAVALRGPLQAAQTR